MMRSAVAAVIPALDEAGSIGRVVEATRNHVDYVLVVDNGSCDGTAEAARERGAAVLPCPSPQGLGAALVLGIRHCFSRGFASVATLDGDGAHDSQSVVDVIATHMARGADVTIGSRVLASPRNPVFPSAKLDANRFAASLLRVCVGLRLSDVASGLRVLSRNVQSCLPTAIDYGFAYELLCLASSEQLRFEECPIGVRYDARVIFGTRTTELAALLRAAVRFTRRPQLVGTLERLSERVAKMGRVSVRLEERTFILHPIQSGELYLIQEQHEFYEAGDDGDRDQVVTL